MLKRRQLIKPIFGHLKADGLLDRNWLKGKLRDAMHVILCGAGHNLRMILAHLRAVYFILVPYFHLALSIIKPRHWSTDQLALL